MNEITLNPLTGIVNPEPRKKVSRPVWMCRHPEAILVDMVNWTYRCTLCNPTLGTIKVIPTVSTKVRSPKAATVSPTLSESPKGFS
jgi:hypothetical protein